MNYEKTVNTETPFPKFLKFGHSCLLHKGNDISYFDNIYKIDILESFSESI